jgi:hypothetical protein
VGAAVGEAAYPVGEILAVGACGDLVGGACPVVAGSDDAAYQLRGVVAGAAAHDVQVVGLLGVFAVAFGDPLIQVGGVCDAITGLRSLVRNHYVMYRDQG